MAGVEEASAKLLWEAPSHTTSDIIAKLHAMIETKDPGSHLKASLTSDKSYQIDSSIALIKAIGGRQARPSQSRKSHQGPDRSAPSQ
jgi:hypothetical protein